MSETKLCPACINDAQILGDEPLGYVIGEIELGVCDAHADRATIHEFREAKNKLFKEAWAGLQLNPTFLSFQEFVSRWTLNK